MVSPASGPYIRPHSALSASTKKQAQGSRKPPPLNLRPTKAYSQQSKIKAVRGSVCWTDEGTEVPLMMDVISNRPAPGNSEAKASGILGAMPHEWSDKGVSMSRPVAEANESDMDLGPRPVSPQKSLRTIIDLDSNGSDSESDISPLEEERPSMKSSKVLARFFPELQGNFAVMPPDGVENAPKPKKGRSRVENEIEERVQNLYHTSPDAHPGQRSTLNDLVEESHDMVSDFDFEHRSTAWGGRNGHSERKRNNFTPSRSATFDDTASMHSGKTPTSSRTAQMPLKPTRYNSTASKASKTSAIQDLRYKPLPLAPVMEPGSTERASRPSTSRGQTSNCEDCSAHQSHYLPHSAYANNHKQSHRCHTCGRHGEHRHHRDGSVPRSEHHRPAWRHDTEQMEIQYGGEDGSGRRVLVLDGPLQISRNNHGDLVAARPAPLPPSRKPYSESSSPPNAPLESLKKEARRTGSSNSLRADSVRKKGHKYSRSKESNDSNKDSKPPKSKEESKGSRWSSNSKSNDSSFGGDLHKLKKSFSISRPTFHRKQNSRADERRFSRLSTLSSRSETAVDPQDDLSKPNEESQRLSRHLSLSHPNLEVVPGEEEGSNKRDDLLLQLPRLQTDNLGFKNLLDQFGSEQRSAVARPPQPAQPEKQEKQEKHEKPERQEETHDDTKDAKEVIPAGVVPELPPNDARIPAKPPHMMRQSNRMRQSTAFVSTAKASSVYVQSERIYELAAEPASPTGQMAPMTMSMPRSKPRAQFNIQFPVDMIKDSYIELLMERMPSLDDLFNFALINRRFYRIFKQRELLMIKNALFKMSRPAWELREMSPPWTTEWQLVLDPDSQVPEYTGNLYLDRYANDIFILAQLKSMVLMRCAPFLRRDTIRGLAGMDDDRAEEVDNAFWRIWTFCRIFGSGKGRENDIEGQVDWLKGGHKARKNQAASSSMMTEPFGMNNVLFEPPVGFARGNCGGLTPRELYDMTEIWNCMNVLVQPLHGKCIEARKVGIFDGLDVPDNDPVREETVLEEWTSWVLTLGMSAVLAVSSLNPSETPAVVFNRARDLGLTKWELTETRVTRSSFMKEAVSRVYEDQERSLSLPSGSSDSPCELPSDEVPTRGEENERRQILSLQIRQQRSKGGEEQERLAPDNTFASERPMSTFSTILGNLEGMVKESAPPVPPVPGLSSDRSSTSTDGHSPIAPGTPENDTDTSSPNHVNNQHYLSSSVPSKLIPTSDPFESRPRSLPRSARARSPQRTPPMTAFVPAPLQPQVQDPVDRAILRMVNELGFNEDDVKWALKITDTGEGINVQAAEQLLQQQKKKSDRNPLFTRGTKHNSGKNPLLMSVIKQQQGAQDSGWRWA
ncbi:hypothetical protein N7456_010507 [Penicillium angulare]|uniref:Uncharacterized protein n=1 Tax=Penicillium angulare TaxID=116970 RepID=A0A9W9F6Y0_9EURO|nr:hypothetical protein N7456_010507 [Penicillium angulare]